MADQKLTALNPRNALLGTDVVYIVDPTSGLFYKSTIDVFLAYARTNMYPQVATYADLPISTGSGNIYIVQTSTGIWPLRKYAGFWRDTGGGWVWLGNATWVAGEIGFAPTGNISSTDVAGALSELDTEKQPLAANLTAISALVSAADALPYFTGSGTAAVTTFTAAGRALVDDADAAAQRVTLGLGTVSTLASDTDGALAANSDARVATQKATKTYVDAAVTGLLDFKGSTDCSANPNYPAALKGDAYVVSVAGKIGGAAGIAVDVGDVYLAIADNAGGTQAAVGASWDTLEHNLVGALLSANNLSDLANAGTARTNLGLGTAALLVSDTDGTLAANSDAKVATQKATKTYVDASRAPSIQTVVSSATVTPTFSDDQVNITAQAAALTLANPTGTAVAGKKLNIRIKDNGTAQTIAFDTQYRAMGANLPVITVPGKTLYLNLVYNSTDTKWDILHAGYEGQTEGLAVHPGYLAGPRWYTLPYGGIAVAGVAITILSQRMVGFWLTRPITISALGARVAGVSAGGNFVLAIYASDPTTFLPTGLPLAKSSGNMSTATATIVTSGGALASNVTLTPGFYYAAIQCDNATATFQALSGASNQMASLLGSANSGTIGANAAVWGPTYLSIAYGTYGTWPDVTGGSFGEGTALGFCAPIWRSA